MNVDFHVTGLTIRYLGIDISLGNGFHCHNMIKNTVLAQNASTSLQIILAAQAYLAEGKCLV
jgi:hypothetical protein